MFQYFNKNPDGAIEEDCVCRAISLATALPYHTVNNLLELNAKVCNCDKLTVSCYSKLLEDIFGFQVHYAKDYETVQDIASYFPYNKVLIRIDGHLTASMYGLITDIWDCADEYVDMYWIVG